MKPRRLTEAKARHVRDFLGLDKPADKPGAAVPGQKLGRYRLGAILGQGGMGTVFRATDEDLNRPVAVKVLSPAFAAQRTASERFQREARAVAMFQAPNIVRIYDVGESNGLHYQVMELIEGGSMQDILAADAPAVTGRPIVLLEKVARAVDFAHRHGVIHRDLKPTNILIDKEGEPHVADFGLARIEGEDLRLTRSAAILGTPLYMSPEQVRGETARLDARSDVYALGVMLYEILTGQLPFDASNTQEIYSKILNSEPPSPRKRNPGVPVDLETVCMKALSRAAGSRYPTAAAFADDLQRCLAGEPIRGRRESRLRRLIRGTRRHPIAWSLGSLAFAGAIVAGIFALHSSRTSHELDQTRRDLSDTDLALQISSAHHALTIETQQAMRRLEDRWHEVDPDRDVDAELAALVTKIDAVGVEYPGTRLPLAWRGIARMFGGRHDQGIADLEAACATTGKDPLPIVLFARAKLAIYSRKADLPRYQFDGVKVISEPFAETEEMTRVRVEATALLERAIAMEFWKRLRHGREQLVLTYAKGLLALAGRKYADAAARLHEARAHPLLESEAFLLEGMALYFDEKLEDALLTWKEGSARGWPRFFAYGGLGLTKLALMEQGRGMDGSSRFDMSIAILSEADRLCPRSVGTLSNRGMAYFHRAGARAAAGKDPFPDLEMALKDFDLILAHAPDALLTLNGRANTWARIAEYRKAVRQDPAEAERRAIRDYTAALTVEPRSLSALIGRGSLFQSMAERHEHPDEEVFYSRAIEDFTAAIAAGGTVAGHNNRGTCYQGRGHAAFNRNADGLADIERSIVDFTAVLEQADNPNVLCNRSFSYLLKGWCEDRVKRDASDSYARGLADVNTAIGRGARMWNVYFNRGLLNQALGQWSAAVEAYREAVRLNPRHGPLQDCLKVAEKRLER